MSERVIFSNKSEHWYKENTNILHRLDGPAIEYPNGSKEWWQNGLLHREDGPAIEYPNGEKIWCKNGKIHREDGPAIEYASDVLEWWLDGKRYIKEQWEYEVNLSSEEKEIRNLIE